MPALIGGGVAGILSAVPFLNCLCCLWIIGGAMLSAYLLAKDSPKALTSGDGAIVGAFAGFVAAVVDTFLSIPFHALNTEFIRRIMDRVAEFSEEMPSGWESWFEKGVGPISVAWFLLGLVISAVLFAALGALGGILGVALFGKKHPPSPEGVKDESSQNSSHR